MTSELILSADEVARLGCEDGEDVTLSLTGTLVHQPDGSAKISDPVVEKEGYAGDESGDEEEDSGEEHGMMGEESPAPSAGTGSAVKGARLHKNPTIAIILGGGMKGK